ncbi:endonuclease Q family protein [Cytobacillus spongiae]|uniref:endonuclease Q family protein n=1 Tax=Cytobacillus spongiae TaxID=2901381 RepID=UPI001F46F17C|nr:endonuclease Q family protein [Cytobacillus spongiae]UII56515.1 endonuclease Q family protein [Cytobacillus spongiae]
MYRKNCTKCNRPSFSSSEVGKWICPICGNDLTGYPFFDAVTLERIPIYPWPFTKKLHQYTNPFRQSS